MFRHRIRRHARRRLRRWLFAVPLLALAGAALQLVGPAAANAVYGHPCGAHAVLLAQRPAIIVRLSADSRDCLTPQVTVQAWLAPSASGNPIAAQTLEATGYDGPLPVWPKHVDVRMVGNDIDTDCFHQVDVAYGHGRDDLTVPYGPDLLAAFHFGDRSCFWQPPTSTPPASTPPPSSSPPASTTPPASSPPVTTPPPATTQTWK